MNIDSVGVLNASDECVTREIWFMVQKGSYSFVPIFVFHINCHDASHPSMGFFLFAM